MRRILVVAASCLFAMPAGAAVVAANAWVRAALPGQDSLAAYVTLTSDRDDTLVGVEAEGFGMAMMHQSVTKNGVSSMEDTDSVNLVAHQPQVFAPGKRHIMLMDFTAPPAPGGHVALTLHFAHAKPVHVDALVKPATSTGP